MKKLLVSKILKKNMPISVENNEALNIIFSETGEMYINKTDGKLLKISDVSIVNTLDNMHKIPTPSTNKIYICIDDKSIHIWDGIKFIMLSGGDREVLNQLKKQLEDHLIEYSRFTETNAQSMNDMLESIIELTARIDRIEEDIATEFTNISGVLTNINTTIISIKNDVDAISGVIDRLSNSMIDINNNIEVINASLLEVVNNVSVLESKIEEIEIKYNEMRGEIDSLNADNIEFKKHIDEKMYNVEFNIVDKLCNLEVLDNVDIEGFIFEPNQHIIPMSITLKTSVIATEYIQIELIHRNTVAGTTIDKVIGVAELNPGAISSFMDIPTEIKYNSGIMAIKIVSNGNMHPNLRIVTKIKRVHTT